MCRTSHQTTAQGFEDTSELFEYCQFWSSDPHSLISLLSSQLMASEQNRNKGHEASLVRHW